MAEMRWFPAKDEQPGVVGRFAWYDLLDIPASEKADEKVYRKIVVLYEKVGGSPEESVRKVRPENQQQFIKRYPDAWAYFEGAEVKIVGTPLADMVLADGTRLNEDSILKFRIQGISSIEQMAEISDAICQNLGFGTRKLRERAQWTLAEKQKAQMAALLAPQPPPAPSVPSGHANGAATPKRRGRPPKAMAAHA